MFTFASRMNVSLFLFFFHFGSVADHKFRNSVSLTHAFHAIFCVVICVNVIFLRSLSFIHAHDKKFSRKFATNLVIFRKIYIGDNNCAPLTRIEHQLCISYVTFAWPSSSIHISYCIYESLNLNHC